MHWAIIYCIILFCFLIFFIHWAVVKDLYKIFRIKSWLIFGSELIKYMESYFQNWRINFEKVQRHSDNPHY